MSEYKEYKCKCCAMPFFGRTRDRKIGKALFCSRECAHEGNKGRLQEHDKHCRNCSRDFKANNPLAKFCSHSCRQSYSKRLRRVDRRNGVFKKIAQLPCELCGYARSSRDVHHIKPVASGGSNAAGNLICLCPNCHRECHEFNFSQETLFKIVRKRNLVIL